MPLIRDRIVGCDAERMVFEFTMLNKGVATTTFERAK